VAPIAGLAALSLAVFFYFHKPTPKSYRLRITAGNALGMRHQLALRLQGEAAKRNITFELVPSLGSEQALDWVERREVDLALVQGALNSVSLPNVREVAPLHIEPMHLLAKEGAFQRRLDQPGCVKWHDRGPKSPCVNQLHGDEQ
jgi:TRAP-type uncharacterized transport system substrate-binding protein